VIRNLWMKMESTKEDSSGISNCPLKIEEVAEEKISTGLIL